MNALPVGLADRIILAPSGCWIWIGSRDRRGYGRYKRQRKWAGAHRVVYEAVSGPIPPGLHIDHLCRVHRCVNPMHLQPVPKAVNDLRGWAPMAVNARKTQCIHGHPFTPANTYIRTNGRRDCRACIRARVAAYSARKRARAA